MSLLDTLASMAGGGDGQQGGNASLLPALIEHLNQYPGGLSGLIASFQKGGLGEIVASWVGKGENLPVSADQLGSVLDPGVVQSLADKTGQDASSVLGSLSTMLPQLVDKATPDGTAQPGQSFNPTDLLASCPACSATAAECRRGRAAFPPRPAAGACCRRWRWARCCRCRPARRAGRCKGTFLQLWRSHLDLTPAQWAERIAACRRLGSREIFLQWVGLEGGRPDDWMAPDAVLGQIFDEAARHGMGVHVGLPYDQRWWNVLATPDDEALARYLDLTREQGLAYMRTAPWSARRNFRGWYLPYELEQYNWASAPRQALLWPWLDAFARAALGNSGARPASTYFSRLGGSGTGTTVARHPGPCARASHDPGRRGRGGPGQPEGAGAAAPFAVGAPCAVRSGHRTVRGAALGQHGWNPPSRRARPISSGCASNG